MCESLDIPKFRLTMQTKIILKELLEKDKSSIELKAKSGYIAGNIYSTLNRLLKYGLVERKGKKYSITERGRLCIDVFHRKTDTFSLKKGEKENV